MSERTPTTEEIREKIGCTAIDDYEYNYTDYQTGAKYVEEVASFDRWLESVKAKAGAEALRNYASAVREYGRPNAWDKSDVADDVEIWADELEAEK